MKSADIYNNSQDRSSKSLLYTAMLVALLNFVNPTNIKSQSFINSSKKDIEQVLEYDILNRIQQRT